MGWFGRLAAGTAAGVGSPAFLLSQLVVTAGWLGVWLAAGRPDGLQIAFINVLTVTTWLVLILVQHSQNADTLAIQAKLDELLRAVEAADDGLIGLEKRTGG